MPCGTYELMTAWTSRGRNYSKVAIVEKRHKDDAPVRIDARLHCILRVVKIWRNVPSPRIHLVVDRAEDWVAKLNDPLSEHILRHDPPPGFDLEPPVPHTS